MLSGKITESFIIDEDFPDPDIACHARLAGQSGICVYGEPVNNIFPEIPEEDFWSSLTYDLDDYMEKMKKEKNPKKIAEYILNPVRVLSYKYEKKILSKYESVLWSLNHVPEKYRYIINNAIKLKFSGDASVTFNLEDSEKLYHFLIDEIRG